MAGLVLAALAALWAPSAQAMVTEDFNGDGKSDLLWRQGSTGATVLWLMNGTSVESAYNMGGSSDWSVVASGDFNGDGYADLIWRQASTGLNVMWLMNGAALPGALLQANLGGSSDWSVVATGDFNGDGKTDLIWRQASTGATVLWLMNGASVEAAYNIGGSSDWSVVATGDFNGDGYADLIWRQASTGATVLWLMNGASLPTVLSIASLGGSSDWSVTLTGDFNGDGKTDLVWRQASTGTTVVWFMNGASLTSVLSLGGSTDWSAIGAGDFNGDGTTDLVWHQASTGATVLWLLNGATSGSVVESVANDGGSNDWAVTTPGGSLAGTGAGGSTFWLAYSATPVANTIDGQSGIYVLPSDLSTTAPQLVSSAGILPYSQLGITLNINRLLSSHFVQPAMIMYANTDAGSNVHVYSLYLGDTSSVPVPQQVSTFSATLAQWCGSGGNGTLGSGSGGVGSGSTNVFIPTSEWVIVETAGTDGTCFTADDVYTLVNNDTGTATQVSINPAVNSSEAVSSLISATGALQGTMVFDAGNNLYFYKDLTFTSPTTLVAGARPVSMVGSSGLPIDFPIAGILSGIDYSGSGANGVRFIQLADAAGVSYLYAVTVNSDGTPTATKVYTAGGSLGSSGYADSTYFYFTDTVPGTPSTVIVRLPLNGAATPVALYSAATNDTINLVGTDGVTLVYTDGSASQTSIETLSVAGPGLPTTIATFAGTGAIMQLATAASGAPASTLYVTLEAIVNGSAYSYSTEVLSLNGSVSNATPNSVYLYTSPGSPALFQVTGITDTNAGLGGGALATVTFSNSVSKPVTYLPGGAPYIVPAGSYLQLLPYGEGDVFPIGGSTIQGLAYGESTNQLTSFGFTDTTVIPIF